tara:strand:+ start:1876 stop:2613 length:738 start_codon:yes stop_codon:yes gene_type:complete
MIFKRIIPSLLLKNFRLVKGQNFKDYLDAGDPVKTIKAYCDQGADEIILSIIDENYNQYQKLLNEISRNCNVPLCIYGGVKTLEDAQFYFRNGADKVGVNSYGLINKNIFNTLAKIYGSQSICSTINYISEPNRIFDFHSGQTKDVKINEYIEEIQYNGVGEIKITNVNKEGTLTGPDTNMNQLLKYIKVPLIYEGGISRVSDIKSLFNKGVNSVALGAILVFKDMNIVKIKSKLFDLNENVRLH